MAYIQKFKWLVLLVFIFFGVTYPILESEAASGYVPVRNVFESMGASVSWNQSAKVIEIKRGKQTVTLTIGSRTAYKNGQAVLLSVPIRLNHKNQTEISTLDVYQLAKREKPEFHYRVKVNDTLWKVSQRFHVSIYKLVEWNRLTSSVIYPGQHLHVADPYYVVKQGDTLFNIAEKRESSISAIRRANRLTLDLLQPGQRLWIPPEPSIKPPDMFQHGVFPLVEGTYSSYTDDYGNSRSFSTSGNHRSHEGIDIFAKRWVPIFSVHNGKVVRKGWNTYGGWRLSIKSDNGIAFYYAHMAGYAPGVKKGTWVKKGQLIGYVGATGYGQVGTKGMFVPHLHFGMYNAKHNKWQSMNPFHYLQWWE